MKNLAIITLLFASLSASAYEDSRDISKSKAKSQLRTLHSQLNDIDKTLEKKTSSKFRDNSHFEDKYKRINKAFEKIAEKDSGWNLSKEREHFKKQQSEVSVAITAYQRAKVEKNEPDPEEHLVPAYNGAPEMKAGAPTWCDAGAFKATASGMTKNNYYDYMIYRLQSRDILAQAQHPCRAPDYDKRQAWSRNWKQVIANATGADEELVVEYYSVLMKNDANKRKLEKSHCKDVKKKFSKKKRSADNEKLADYNKAMVQALGCNNDIVTKQTSSPNLGWWIDIGDDAPSELLRAMLILDRLDIHFSEDKRRSEHDYTEQVDRQIGNYAFVRNDIESLDAERFKKELKELKLNEWGEVMAKLTFAKAKHYGQFFTKEFESDATLKALAIDAPKAGYAKWVKAYEAHKETFDKGAQIEEEYYAGKRNDFGCHVDMQSAFRKYVTKAAKGQKTKDDKLAVMRDAVAANILRTSLICASYDGEFNIASTLYGRFDDAPIWRGPRTAAHFAVFEKYNELKEKNAGLRIKADWLIRGSAESKKLAYNAYANTFNKTKSTRIVEGRISSVKKSKKGLLLKFKTETISKPIYKCKETNRIDRITSDGKIVYRRNCKKTGTKKEKVKILPFTVPLQFASKIKKGNFVKAKVIQADKRIGIPFEVYKSKKRKRLIGALGADL